MDDNEYINVWIWIDMWEEYIFYNIKNLNYRE